ncbi:MAG: TonB-dependent receptor [Fibrobacterota bacterium]|nr:TonB-dependent receptor [Fibrobacterota bacterium]
MKAALTAFLLLATLAAAEGSGDIGASQGASAPIDSLPMVKTFIKAAYSEEAIRLGIENGYTFSLDSLPIRIEPYTNFKGRLREKGTRTPIPDAMVVVEILDTSMDAGLNMPLDRYLRQIGTFPGQAIEEGKLVTATDTQGYFEFKSLPACSIKVSFPVSGYMPASFKETLVAGKRLEMDYRILRDSYDEYEIVVFGKGEKTEVGRTTLSVSEIKRVPGFGGDAIKVVRALPGVARPTFISGEILIRGSGPEDSRFLLDGVSVIRLFHFGAIRSIYHSDLLSSIDMYPGGFGARYGGGVGGVVEVKGRPALKDRWHGKMDLNIMDAGGMLEGPLSENLSLQVSGTYSYIGDVIKTATENEATTVAPLYRDAYARLDWNISKEHRGFLTYSTSVDNLEIITPDIRGGSEEVSGNTSAGQSDDWFHLALIGLNSRLNSSLTNELRLSLVQSDAFGSFFGSVQYGQESGGFNVREEMQYTANRYFKFKPGLDLTYESFDAHFGFLTKKGIITRDEVLNTSTLGGYASMEISPSERWLIVPGVRYDYFSEVEDGRPSLRLSSRYEYLKGLTVKGSAGSYSQSPKFTGITVGGIGNPDLPPVEALHFVAGHEWRINDLLSLDLQGYYNSQSDIPNATDSLDPVTGKDLNYIADMDARMYGVEMLLKQDQGRRFFGWVGYSLSRSERRAGTPFAPDLYTANGEWDADAWVLSKNDQTHNLQLVGGVRLPLNWECGLRFQYITGNPASPLKSMTDNKFTYDSELRDYVQEPGDPFSERVGPFVQLDLRVDKKFVYKSWMLSSYLDLSNVNYFFYNSPEIYDYNYDNSKRETIGAIFFPSIGVKAEF